MTYATVCSGVEAMSLAVRGMGWKPVFFSEIEPFPCELLKYHYPDVPNLGDMTKISAKYDEETKQTTITNGVDAPVVLDGRLGCFAGGTPCFAAGTMILAQNGYVPIETIQEGDLVVGGTSGLLVPVTAVGSKMARVGRLKADGRSTIVCTPNHPLMCADGEGGFVKTRADRAVGMRIGMLPRVECANCARELAETKFDDHCGAELAGWYLGCGAVGVDRARLSFKLMSGNSLSRFTMRFGGKLLWKVEDGLIVIDNGGLAEWLVRTFGDETTGKRIPYWCYSARREELLRGFGESLEIDLRNGDEVRIPIRDKALALGLADLLGTDAKVRFLKDECLMSAGDGADSHERGTSKVRSYNVTRGADGFVRVFNITVADEHTYVAEGFYVHNCQDVSVAGKRAGMAEGSGTRSSLAFHFVRLCKELQPRWILWENVAGALSANGGRDFAKFIDALVQCGYCCAWRVLDGQYVRVDGEADWCNGSFDRAVPQRRRRVWVVGVRSFGHPGEMWRAPAEILFEAESMRGAAPPRRKTREEVAADAEGRNRDDDGSLELPFA